MVSVWNKQFLLDLRFKRSPLLPHGIKLFPLLHTAKEIECFHTSPLKVLRTTLRCSLTLTDESFAVRIEQHWETYLIAV